MRRTNGHVSDEEIVWSSARPTRNRQPSLQTVRLIVQIAFALLCIWIGLEFHHFVGFIESGGQSAVVNRPPGVDGFLPISSLMSLYYFLLTGIVHPFHPAGMFILSAIVLVSLVFGKAFCSWLCPVGLLSELLGDVSRKLVGRNLRVPRWLDYPLRSLKYLLLGFFVYSIFFVMNVVALRAFLDSPYNLVADIRMYYFFADISRFSLMVIGILFLLSLVIRNFWCRYLCPYGALLGIIGLLSLTKIRRNPSRCIDCGKCAKVCPSFIKVDKVQTVISDECTTCLACVDSCPVADTLEVKTSLAGTSVNKRWVAIGVVGLFIIITGLGILTGNWQNRVSPDEYLRHRDSLRTYGHPTGTDDLKSGRENRAPFWINMRGRFIHIEYLALRDKDGAYLGTLEVSQDLTEKRALEGEQRLLSYARER